jgi:hypothetical protein
MNHQTKQELRVKHGYYSQFLTKPFWQCSSISFMAFQELTFHGVHHTTSACISWFPVLVRLLLNIKSYLQNCGNSARSAYPSFSCGNPLGVKILFCALCSNVGLIWILLPISLSSAASCVTYGTATKSPFYTVYRSLVTWLLTQRN